MAACGGGGGGSSQNGASYVGVTTPAAVNAVNAKALSVDAFSGSQLSASFAGLQKEVPLGSPQPSLVLGLCRLVQDSLGNALGSRKSPAKDVAATAQQTVNGYRGSYTIVVTDEPGASTFTGTITLSQYQEDSTSVTLSGVVRMSGPVAYGGTNGTGDAGSLDPVVIELVNVTGTLGSESLSLNGGMSYLNLGDSEGVTMSMLITDNVANRTYWMKDYVLDLTGNQLTITGTYYHPVHGFVVITTPTPLTASALDAWPTAGHLLFTGSFGSKARLTFAGTSYLLEVDAAGNGNYTILTP